MLSTDGKCTQPNRERKTKISLYLFSRNLSNGLFETRQSWNTNQANAVKNVQGMESYCHLKFYIKDLSTNQNS